MHKNNFNVLRLLFAVGVIFSHSFELLRHPDPLEGLSAGMSVGTLGVCGFFLLSGYLTAQSWSHEPRARVPEEARLAALSGVYRRFGAFGIRGRAFGREYRTVFQ
ncbi:acyltransferase family protein [Paraburkholderia eburnea]|uniref:acyltransferase family protein n=1 Tax=Paraburkholderia eburnea TaxID=1189126 RepID=UPI0011B0AF4A|nr:acyltransferase family protein [Paraburkholderia eburnea]